MKLKYWNIPTWLVIAAIPALLILLAVIVEWIVP